MSSQQVNSNQVHDNVATCNNRYLLPLGFQPSEDDIKIGRGKKIVAHNAKFYKIIHCELEDYKAASSKVLKSKILLRVLKHIKEVVGGKFVKEDTTNGRWFAVEDSLARTTIAQAFRDSLHTSYRSSKQFKQRRRRQAKVSTTSSSPPSDASSLAATNPKSASQPNLGPLMPADPQQLTLFDCAKFSHNTSRSSATKTSTLSTANNGELLQLTTPGMSDSSSWLTATKKESHCSTNYLTDILTNAVSMSTESSLSLEDKCNRGALLPMPSLLPTVSDHSMLPEMESLDGAFSPSEIEGACGEDLWVSSSLFDHHHQHSVTPLYEMNISGDSLSSFEPTPLREHDRLDELDLSGLLSL